MTLFQTAIKRKEKYINSWMEKIRSLSFIPFDKSQKLKIKREILKKFTLPALLCGAQTSLQVEQTKIKSKILQIVPQKEQRHRGENSNKAGPIRCARN